MVLANLLQSLNARGNKAGDKLAGRKSNPQKEITNNIIRIVKLNKAVPTAPSALATSL